MQPHRARPAFDRLVPAHLTLRAKPGVPNMRTEVASAMVIGEIRRAAAEGFRVLHFSVQTNHVHLVVEADDGEKLSRGMQRLASRIAMALNGLARRRGAVWRERYHRRDLASPRQFRNALVYVTMNFRKHASARERAGRARVIDGCSSAMWLRDNDWASAEIAALLARERPGVAPPVAAPTTWIANVGWKRYGKLDPTEQPRSPG